MDGELAVVKLFKFDPAVDGKPRYETYEVPHKDWTMLDVLNYLYEQHDPSLSFRSGCKVGNCTCCLVSVNGKPVFSCQKLAERKMTIEPHPKFEVVKDLVVDFDLPKK
ncbi:2Fe-2S iron-sulfur cluster-binding protein [Chloroflexota bacterium]